jgi:hypothetical protein
MCTAFAQGTAHLQQAGTCVRETPLEIVVGMQQKIASPNANSLGTSGSCDTGTAMSGVTNRIATRPYNVAPQEDSARSDSPLFKFRP